MQRTDGCTNHVYRGCWLLVQTHLSIHCSHKRYTNRHLNQHMVFRNCEEEIHSSYKNVPNACVHNHRMKGRLCFTRSVVCLLYRLGPRVKKIKNGYPESSKDCYNINLKKYIWCIRNHCIASFSGLQYATRANKVW